MPLPTWSSDPTLATATHSVSLLSRSTDSPLEDLRATISSSCEAAWRVDMNLGGSNTFRPKQREGMLLTGDSGQSVRVHQSTFHQVFQAPFFDLTGTNEVDLMT